MRDPLRDRSLADSAIGRCIASKAGVTLAELDPALLRLPGVRAVILSLGPCYSCQRDTLRYRLGPGTPPQ